MRCMSHRGFTEGSCFNISWAELPGGKNCSLECLDQKGLAVPARCLMESEFNSKWHSERNLNIIWANQGHLAIWGWDSKV